MEYKPPIVMCLEDRETPEEWERLQRFGQVPADAVIPKVLVFKESIDGPTQAYSAEKILMLETALRGAQAELSRVNGFVGFLLEFKPI